MFLLLHGDDTNKSRQLLIAEKQKAKGKEVRSLDGKNIEDGSLIQALSSSSLFGGDTVVVIENLFSGIGKKQKRVEALLALLKEHSKDVDCILWEDKEVGKTVLSGLPKGSSVVFSKLPTIIFQFLDSLEPNRAAQLLPLYQRITPGVAPELVHAMLKKRILLLLDIKQGNSPQNVQVWQLSRLTNQARLFTMDRLLWMYKRLVTAEFERNSGTGVFGLKEATELILAEL